jgi:16S rRNA (guanine527-N7)-methyltransferase
VNLTAIVDPTEIERRHFLDSLSCLAGCADLLAERPDARLVDVGSGAGFPGLPLKIVRPALRLTLVESVGRKARFLEHLLTLLNLPDVEVVTARAEDLAQNERYRERFDLGVSRAVARLPALLELTLPFLGIGGRLVAPRRGDLAAQQVEAERAVAALGGRFRPAVRFGDGSIGGQYGLVLVDKVGPTPAAYPRRAGRPVKRPLL